MSIPASYLDPQVVADLTAAAAAGGGDFRALVCVFLFGGNDHDNTILPREGINRQQYDFYRPDQVNVGIAANEMPLNELSSAWRLHPALDDLKTIWDAGDLAVLMNTGMLIRPVTGAEYAARNSTFPPLQLPLQLFSHNNQQQQWMVLPRLGAQLLNGWFGRAVDLAGIYYNPAPTDDTLPGFSVAGRQKMMDGFVSKSSDLQSTGPSVIEAAVAHTTTIETGGYIAAARARSQYENVLQGYYAQSVVSAIAKQASLNTNLQTLPATPNGKFDAVPNNTLAQQLRVVARVIHSRTNFAQRRQLFFVSLGGFDTHDALRSRHDALMTTVNEALATFWSALGDLSMQDNVATFTASDFGRALLQNGRLGTDHGWGGHHFVMGGGVNGALYGADYDMRVDGPQDSGQGRSIPTISVDQYAGSLLEWWGIPQQHLHLVVENIGNFPTRTVPGLFA